MLKEFDNWIFDLDGTLINSSEEVLLCFKKAFKKANYDIDESRFTSDVIGPPLKLIIKTLAPALENEEIVSTIIGNFRQLYDYEENDVSIMYEGTYELLKQLKSSGKRLFIATFKPTIPTMRLIKKFKLSMFDDIYTIDKFGSHITKAEMIEDIVAKYNLDKSRTVMIGDASSDVIAAKEACVRGIGVLWGYGSDKTKLLENADITVEKPEELISCQKLNCPTI